LVEGFVELLRAKRESRQLLTIKDPQPLASAEHIWGSASQTATVGIFILALLVALHLGSPILLPVVAALIVAMTLAPIIKAAARQGVSPWLASTLIVIALVAAAAAALTFLAAPVIALIDRAPDIAASIKQKLYVLDLPLAALRDLQNTLMPPAANSVKVEPSQITLVAPVVAVVTPALAQMVIFAATLFFALVGQVEARRHMTAIFTERDAKLRFLRIVNDIEDNLASYVMTVTAINICLGIAVAAGAWMFGFDNPLILGLLITILNYLPYIGPGCMVVILFAIGLVTFPTLGYALLPPAAFIALTTIEGQIITPTILGHRLTLNPLVVFLSIVFWGWLWGPIGAFLAVPLSLIALVVANHLLPEEDLKLPG
jgi:predicted PurR-regulated permease PerM